MVYPRITSFDDNLTVPFQELADAVANFDSFNRGADHLALAPFPPGLNHPNERRDAAEVVGLQDPERIQALHGSPGPPQ